MSDLPQLAAAMRDAGLTARAQQQIIETCDLALAAQLAADAERLPAGLLVTLWRQAPSLARASRVAGDEATEPDLVSP